MYYGGIFFLLQAFLFELKFLPLRATTIFQQMREHNGNDIIKWLVVFNDFVILNITLIIFTFAHTKFSPEIIHSETKLFFFVGNSAMVIAQYFFSTIVHLRYVSFKRVFGQVSKLILTQVALAVIFIHIIRGPGGIFRFAIAFTIVFFTLVMCFRFFERWVLKYYRMRGGNTRSVLFVGNDPALINVYQELSDDPSTGYIVKGYYAKQPIQNLPSNIRLTYKGTIADLDHLMKDNSDSRLYDEVFCSMSHSDSEEIVRIMRYCDDHVIHFYYVPRLFGNFRLNLTAERVGSLDLFTNHVEPLANSGNRIIKRLFDIAVSGFALLCILPFIPIIAVIIKIQSPGPLFFGQERTGLNGETFKCLKFRSMHVNKDADTVQATKNDPRKFPFGNFMRKSNLDEFPQFFNVLKGDMSIVGPRPHMLHHTEIYSELIDKYMVRHFSKPGITGWAQVTGFRGETKELWQMEERIRRDIWYIENWSLWLDIKIILMTAWSIIHPDKHAY